MGEGGFTGSRWAKNTQTGIGVLMQIGSEDFDIKLAVEISRLEHLKEHGRCRSVGDGGGAVDDQFVVDQFYGVVLRAMKFAWRERSQNLGHLVNEGGTGLRMLGNVSDDVARQGHRESVFEQGHFLLSRGIRHLKADVKAANIGRVKRFNTVGNPNRRAGIALKHVVDP